MEPEQFYALVNGRGCPCCNDNGLVFGFDEPSQKNIDAWRESVAYASEGTIDEWQLIPQCVPAYVEVQNAGGGIYDLNDLMDRYDAGAEEIVTREQIGWTE
jgi:hypothetical protein